MGGYSGITEGAGAAVCVGGAALVENYVKRLAKTPFKPSSILTGAEFTGYGDGVTSSISISGTIPRSTDSSSRSSS